MYGNYNGKSREQKRDEKDHGREEESHFYAILAAALYAGNSPLSKLFLEEIPAALMAGFLYLGAGIGIFIMNIVEKPWEKRRGRKVWNGKNCLM